MRKSLGGMDDEVRVKVRIGDIEVEITGTPEKIGEVVPNIIESIKSGATPKEQRKPIGRSCKDVIYELWREGWFKEERRLGDVYEELTKRGYYFDKSAISHALSSLVKEGILTRMGKERRYTYVQKIPYTTKIRG